MRVNLTNKNDFLGINPVDLRGSRTGVFVGCSASETSGALTQDPETVTGYTLTGCVRSMFSNRISYTFDLQVIDIERERGVVNREVVKTSLLCSGSLVLSGHSLLVVSAGPATGRGRHPPEAVRRGHRGGCSSHPHTHCSSAVPSSGNAHRQGQLPFLRRFWRRLLQNRGNRRHFHPAKIQSQQNLRLCTSCQVQHGW